MIPVLDLLLDIDNKLNDNSNLVNQFIPNEVKITFLNNAQDKLILKKLGLNNNYKLGLDAFAKRYEDLQVLVVPYTKFIVSKTLDDVFNSYQSDTNTLTEKLFIPIDSYVLATKDGCENRILQVTEIVKHGDLQLKLNSPHFTPSFEYQETLATMTNDLFYTYPDKENSFTITSLYLTYLRYPAKIDIAGYVNLDGSPSANSNCELESYLKNELVDIAVEDLAMATGNQEQVQNSMKRTSENE